MMEAWESSPRLILPSKLSYEEMKKLYNCYFSLGNLNTDIGNKFALISLICYLTKMARNKKPDATCWQAIIKITDNNSSSYDEQFLKALSIVCEDYMTHSNEFLTFNLESTKEKIDKIKNILGTYLPF